MEVGEGEFVDETVGFGKLGVGFAGEANHDVGADGGGGHEGAGFGDAVGVVAGPVFAVHAAEDGVGAGLERGVDVEGDAGGVGHEMEEIVGEVHGLDRGEAEAFDGGFGEEAAEEAGEAEGLARFPAPAAEVDAGKDNFAVVAAEVLDLGDDLVGGHGAAAAADEGDDAE